MEGSGEIYLQLLERLRREMPQVAAQIEREVAEGRRVAALTLSEADRIERVSKMRSTGNRISKDDLATVPYGGDERLALLIEALLCLGSSMAADREALTELLREQHAPNIVGFRSEESTQVNSEINIAAESIKARATFYEASGPLREAMAELQ